MNDFSDWTADEIAHEVGPHWLHALRRMHVLWPKMRPHAEELSEQLKKACELCESPIEARLAIAMLSHNWGTKERPVVATVVSSDTEFAMHPAKMCIMPQCGFFGYRMDFAVRSTRTGRPAFLAVEADGREYHSSGKDSKRDKHLREKGIETVRFSGKQINADAHSCAMQIDKALRKAEQ